MRNAQDNAAHTCSYSCDRPECIKAQRDELAAAAAQEAVAWQRRRADADGLWFSVSKEIYEATQNGKWADRYEVRALYAAPVTAAPAGVTRDDAEQVIDRIMGEYGFSMPSRAYAELVDEFMCTTAAPGIDLTVPDYIKQAHDKCKLWPESNWPGFEPDAGFIALLEIRNWVETLIDASPKGALNEQFGSAEGLDSPKGGIAPCAWTDDGEGNWDTACGERFILLEGSPTDNKMRHCPYCGSHISESAQAGDAEVQP